LYLEHVELKMSKNTLKIAKICEGLKLAYLL
jgi:hypothetical protein